VISVNVNGKGTNESVNANGNEMKRNNPKRKKHENIKQNELESMAIANALQPEGFPTSHQLLWAGFCQICTAYAHKLQFPSFQSKL